MEFELDTTKQFTSDKMQKSMQIFLDDLSSIRTGRASTKIIETIKVNVYGSTLPLNQLASINIIDSTLINVNAWDKNNVDSIVKSIQTSDLGINPAVDGEVIKLSIPPLSEERRQEITKVASKYAENSKISIRNIIEYKKYNPPIHCIEDLHNINPWSMCLIFSNTVNPVDVNPETDSKYALKKVKLYMLK